MGYLYNLTIFRIFGTLQTYMPRLKEVKEIIGLGLAALAMGTVPAGASAPSEVGSRCVVAPLGTDEKVLIVIEPSFIQLTELPINLNRPVTIKFPKVVIVNEKAVCGPGRETRYSVTEVLPDRKRPELDMVVRGKDVIPTKLTREDLNTAEGDGFAVGIEMKLPRVKIPPQRIPPYYFTDGDGKTWGDGGDGRVNWGTVVTEKPTIIAVTNDANQLLQVNPFTPK